MRLFNILRTRGILVARASCPRSAAEGTGGTPVRRSTDAIAPGAATIALFALAACGMAAVAWADEPNVPTRAAAAAATVPVEPPDVMEQLAPAELFHALGDGLVLFTEAREHPVRRFDGVPSVWLDRPAAERATFHGDAQPGEYFVLQIAACAPRDAVGPLAVTAAPLRGPAGVIDAGRVHCISLGGTGPDGLPFAKAVSVPAGGVTPLWFGIDVPRDAAAGDYTGDLVVSAGPSTARAHVTLHVAGPALPDGGVGDPRKLARLSWLDSTVGSEPTVTKRYTPLRCDGNAIHILGRDLTLGDAGLPAQIDSHFSGSNTHILPTGTPLLAAPATFTATTATGPAASPSKLTITGHRDADVDWATQPGAVRVVGHMEFDGSATLDCQVTAPVDTDCQDVRFELPLRRSVAKYTMGLGHFGSARPKEIHWRWDADKFQDALWIGDVNGGVQLRFKGSNYLRPPVNIYYPFRPLVLPDSWDLGGHGGIDVTEAGDDRVTVAAHTGPCRLPAGRTLHFTVDLLLTPFHTLDTDRHWSDRYLHPFEGSGQAVLDKALATLKPTGPNVIELHHATYVNPYINYPFNADSFAALQAYVRQVHDRGARAKVYYTTRELTTNLPEFWALTSLGGEVVLPGPGAAARTVVNPIGPPPWMVQHLPGESYVPAWRARIGSPYNRADYAVITTPDTRWNNFYLAGLQFLCDRAQIDGLYIDDTALDHRSMQRARRILDTRPAGLIDLHSWNHNNVKAHYNDSAGVYMEIMPYLDRLWLGEGFDCDKATPDYWLIEMAGVPYGLMADMLQGGGNPWLGMLFGETGRLGWGKTDPRPMWAAWDRFGMAGTDMVGWWDPACPAHADNADVRVTVYRKPGRAMIVVGNFATTRVTTHLTIDWAALGLSPSKLVAPAIDRFQEADTIDDPAAAITIAGKRAVILTVGT
jgi:hypothetical protein